METVCAARANADRDGAVRAVTAGTALLVFHLGKILRSAAVTESVCVESANVIHQIFTVVITARTRIVR